MDTKLSVQEIEDILIRLHAGGIRSNLCVPNVSWGMGIQYEADLLVVTKAGYCTEYEIKRSYADFLADMKKDESAHKAPWVYRFYYVIPESIKDKVLKYFNNKGGELPGIISYDERGMIDICGGYPYVKGGRRMFLEEQLKVAKLGTMRYWSLRNKTNQTHTRYDE